MFGRSVIPEIYNEPLRDYAPGSKDAILLKEACDRLRKECPDIPCVVGGKEYRTGDIHKQVICSDHKHVLCTYHQATKEVLTEAATNAIQAKQAWESLPAEDRLSVFLKAADLLSSKYRYDIIAATMLGQGKTVWQGEIDAAAETIDFLRINPKFAEQIYAQQPTLHTRGCWNRMEYRSLEGYVVAISPFNFTAIGANLPTAPAMMGNVILWKPASTAILSNWIFYKVLREAGLPDGVIQFLPGSGRLIGDVLINHRDFAGLHFTGSTAVFNEILHKTSTNTQAGLYRGYPRMVGETGGKDFHFIHPSANIESALNNTIRASFEYQGQKCSACSRAYIPSSAWPKMKEGFIAALKQMKMGQSDDFSCFVSAVIDKNSFDNIKRYIDYAKGSKDAEIIAGGECDDSKGYFITPTIILTTDPKFKTMTEEIFGPVLTIYVYPDSEYEKTLHLCDETSPYALTGSIFATDKQAVALAYRLLRNASGNFYINDKCTGAVVGQQPFGGARASGTNDKAGSSLNLLRWVSVRTVKEQFLPCSDWRYPHM